MFFCKAGLEIGEMILAVNKDSLLGSNYETVNISLFFNYILCYQQAFHIVFNQCYVTTLIFYNQIGLQAANLLKRTEGLVTLVVSNPSKRVPTPTPSAADAEKTAALKPTAPPSRPATPTPGKIKFTQTVLKQKCRKHRKLQLKF